MIETNSKIAEKPIGTVDRKLNQRHEKKEIKAGVLYLSKIPTKMNVKILRDHLGEYGELGRVYLQPTGN
jgi:hypothetical protein